MKVMIRIVVTLISGVSTFFFVFWVASPLTLTSQPHPFSFRFPLWILAVGSLLVCAVAAWYVWTHTASSQASLASSVLLGALVVGGIGFSAGFFGPLLFMPSGRANVGPVLGIFITGPLGFILGAAGGAALHWYARESRAGGTSNWPQDR
jgi:hypothetical protein